MKKHAALLRLLAVFAAGTLLPIVSGHLAKLGIVLRIAPITDELRVLEHLDARSLDVGVVATDGTMPIVWTIFWFSIGGALVGAIARRPPLGEVLLASSIVTVVQLLFWLGELGFDLPLLGLDATVGKGADHVFTFGLRSNAVLLLFEVSVVAMIAAVCASLAAAAVSVQLSKQAACRACHLTYDARAGLEACPHCKVVLTPSGFAWSWVAGGVGATVLLFAILLEVAGPTLEYFHHCDPGSLEGTCGQIVREAARDQAKKESPDWILLGRLRRHDPEGERFLNVVQPWKYLAFQSVAFLPAPFVLAWKIRKKGRASAMITLGLGMLASIVVGVTLLLSGGGGEGLTVMLVRIHVFGVVLWSLLGFIASYLGGKRRYASEAGFLDDLESSKKAP